MISHYSLYGGTEELFRKILPPLGIEAVIVDMRDLKRPHAAIKADPTIRMIVPQTPANPTPAVWTWKRSSAWRRRTSWYPAVDNTSLTPYLQQPFAYGQTTCSYSTTEFLNGHGTAIGGVLVGRDIGADERPP